MTFLFQKEFITSTIVEIYKVYMTLKKAKKTF